jgi:hypothetical protein
MKLFGVILVGLSVCAATPLLAETLNNDAVVAMVGAGLGEETVIAKIKNSPNTFNLETANLIALKKQGISDAVIAAMLDASTKAQVSTNAMGMSDSPDPKAPHASGIYLLHNWEKPQKMEIIQPQSANYAKANMMGTMLTMGLAKTKFKSTYSGMSAATKSMTHLPEFYFYFDTAATNLSQMGQAASTPDDFYLMKFDVKKGNREVFVGKGNAFAERGLTRGDGIPVRVEKIADKAYHLVPQAELQPGEYGFVISAETGKGGNSAVAYTFSVQ